MQTPLLTRGVFLHHTVVYTVFQRFFITALRFDTDGSLCSVYRSRPPDQNKIFFLKS